MEAPRKSFFQTRPSASSMATQSELAFARRAVELACDKFAPEGGILSLINGRHFILLFRYTSMIIYS